MARTSRAACARFVARCLGVPCRRGLGKSERSQRGYQRSRIDLSYRALRARICRLRIERDLRNDLQRRTDLLVALENAQAEKFETAQTGNDLNRSNCFLS